MAEIKCPQCNRTEVKYIADVNGDDNVKVAETWWCKFCNKNFGVNVQLLNKTKPATRNPEPRSPVSAKATAVKEPDLKCEVCGAPAKPYVTNTYMRAYCDKHRQKKSETSVLLGLFLLFAVCLLGGVIYWYYRQYGFNF